MKATLRINCAGRNSDGNYTKADCTIFSLLPGHSSKVTFNTITKAAAQSCSHPASFPLQAHNLMFTANGKLTIGSPRLYALTRTSSAPSDQRICAGQGPFPREHC